MPLGAGFDLQLVQRWRIRRLCALWPVAARQGGAALAACAAARNRDFGGVAHLLRDVKFVEDAHGHAWARLMAKLLHETCRKVGGLDAKALDEAAFMALRKRYRTILTKAKREFPKPLPDQGQGRKA